MKRWKGRVALVTGASAGIGAAIVTELVKHGMRVVGCARNVERIQALRDSLSDQPGVLLPIKCDVSKEDDVVLAFSQVRQTYGRLDVLVNNAGMARNSSLLGGHTDDWREMFEVNVLGLSMCTREAYRLMDEGGARDCHIINISSMGGHRLTKTDANFYGMTKSAVNAHTEGIRRELREAGSGYKVSQISPGLVATEFHQRKYGEDVGKPQTQLQAGDLKTLEAQDIVDAFIYLLSSPPHAQVHDIMIRPTHQKI